VADSSSLKTTPLTDWHRAHGARMVPFAGFEMPVQYRGVLAEHEAVRSRVGIFDITHMGEIAVTGPQAGAWLDGLVTNRVAVVAPGKVVYTAMCRPDGGVLDDMLIYRLGDEDWLVVCNASNHEKIAAWLVEHRPAQGVELEDLSDGIALIAVQGPDSPALMGRVGVLSDRTADMAALDFYTALTCDGPGGRWVVSRTGYTGEHGYEIYLPFADAVAVWEELIAEGKDLGVEPIGLGARDTLRFEVGYCLYGHELAEDISPLEAGIGWAVKLKKDAFTGRDALLAQKAAGIPRRLVGLALDERGIARPGAPVLHGDEQVGAVTSGTFSPSLKVALALALVRAPVDESDLSVEVRGKRLACHVVPFPFLPARTKGDPRAERNLPA